MTVIEALFLGLIQGITEFLPISGSRTSDYLPSLYEDRRYADGVFQCAFALWLHDCNSAHIFEGMENVSSSRCAES